MNINKPEWVIVGSSGFPFGFAEIQKIKQIASGLYSHDKSVLVLSRKGIHSDSVKLQPKGSCDGIDYIYASGKAHYSQNFIIRNYYKTLGFLRELTLLYSFKDCKIIINTRNNFDILVYCFIARLTHSISLLTIVEDKLTHSFYKTKTLVFLDTFIYNRISLKSVDILLPISSFLLESLSRYNESAKYLILPPLADADRFDEIELIHKSDYFLFCGSVGYKEIILFIIRAYQYANFEDKRLVLVLHGADSEIKEIENKIGGAKIVIKTSLGERDLFALYKSAVALLIPLRDNVVDKARMPQKIAEYAASGRPIITNKVGDIARYFKHLQDAYICENMSIHEYAVAMRFLAENSSEALKIGNSARLVAEARFSPHKLASQLISIVEE